MFPAAVEGIEVELSQKVMCFDRCWMHCPFGKFELLLGANLKVGGWRGRLQMHGSVFLAGVATARRTVKEPRAKLQVAPSGSELMAARGARFGRVGRRRDDG